MPLLESSRPPLYPVLLAPTVAERLWGGTKLGELLDKELPPGRPIGETWETALDARVDNGPCHGYTLGDLARALGPALVGERAQVTAGVPFPLLAKFIDAAQVLSVQVHPDDRYANERLAAPFGKTEAWYIVAAEPNAIVYHGLREANDRATVERALAEGKITDYLCAVPVRAGDTIFVPAGTVHAIGPGIVLYEIQQYSDHTFRLDDWGRVGDDGQPRALHLEQGLAVADTCTPSAHTIAPRALDDAGRRLVLVACRYFALELWRPESHAQITLDPSSFHLLSVLDGQVSIVADGAEPVMASHGRTALLPAGLGGYTLTASAGTRLLKAYVPDLLADIVVPLRTRGVPDAAIAALGGGLPAGNDLLPLLARDGQSRVADAQNVGRT